MSVESEIDKHDAPFRPLLDQASGEASPIATGPVNAVQYVEPVLGGVVSDGMVVK